MPVKQYLDKVIDSAVLFPDQLSLDRKFTITAQFVYILSTTKLFVHLIGNKTVEKLQLLQVLGKFVSKNSYLSLFYDINI